MTSDPFKLPSRLRYADPLSPSHSDGKVTRKVIGIEVVSRKVIVSYNQTPMVLQLTSCEHDSSLLINLVYTLR